MFDETSDILGGHTLPNVRGNGPGQWSSLSFTLKFAFILALVLVGYVTSIRVWEHLLKWRERTYKLYASVECRTLSQIHRALYTFSFTQVDAKETRYT